MDDVVSQFAFFALVAAQCAAVLAVRAMKPFDGGGQEFGLTSALPTFSPERPDAAEMVRVRHHSQDARS